MLSIVIPTLNAEASLPVTLKSLQGGLAKLAPSQIIVADGGSADNTLELAKNAGARVISSEKGRGNQLAAGANAAGGEWLMFIHADTALQAGWQDTVNDFITQAAGQEKAAVFRFRLDDPSFKARCLEAIVRFRTKLLALPYGDQGLLIARRHYHEVGGFRPIPIMEDVDIVRRIGRRRLAVLECDAITSAGRYRKEGYARRMLRNILCLSMWFLGIAPDRIARTYR